MRIARGMRCRGRYALIGLAVALLATGRAWAQGALEPDVVFVNGKIITLDGAGRIVEAVAARDGRIVAVGTNREIRALAGQSTRVIDVQGRTVIPGFYDNHAHLGTGRDPSIQEWDHISSWEELAAALRARAREVPEGEWIQAHLSTERLPEQVLPTRRELDRVVPNHPVALHRMHVMLVNSLALEKAGITRDTPDPRGGRIDRDERGEPNGILREQPAHRLVERVIPEWQPDPESAEQTLRNQLRHLASLGITSVNVPGVRPHVLPRLQKVYERWGDELPRVTVQIRISPGFDMYDDPEEGIRTELGYIEGLRFYTGFGNDRIKLGAIKMSVDGGMTGQAAWLIDPYKHDPDFHGVVRIPPEVLYAVGRRAHDLGWQLGIHAIGDAAVQAAVDVLDRILTESPRDDHRHYLHHIEVKPPEATLDKMARHGIIAAMQPNFTYSLAPYVENALAQEKLGSVNPQKELIERGIRISFGSDGLPLGPLVGIYAAVTRKGINGVVYGPDQRIGVLDALRYYTLGSAYMTFDEDERGSIEVGKYADMTVLSGDILTIDPERILDLQALMTVVGGEVIYQADGRTTSN